ncbi:MAG: hypothetical protein M1840_001509 [Geoglossum simile]|nr:MAG: hypothetical protein M1840_001509 [Geoglossum simile]
MEDTRPLRLLSLDGGGIRGLSSLYILRDIMHALEDKVEGGSANDPAHHRPLPCEYFDLIAGTSTGGIIAIMLGPLRIDVDTCIKEYLDMAPGIFQVESGRVIGGIKWACLGKEGFDPVALTTAWSPPTPTLTTTPGTPPRCDRGKPIKLEAIPQQSPARFKKTRGPEHISALKTVNNQGKTCRGRGHALAGTSRESEGASQFQATRI